MIFLYAFLFGGLICAIGQLILDLFKLTPGHITGLFVVIGVFLDFFNFYDKLIKVAGAGALLPITSFGHSLVHAAYSGAKNKGIIGAFTAIFDKTAFGISLAIFLSVLIGILCKPKN